METETEIFSKFSENSSSEKIIDKIKKGEWTDILNNLCFIKENVIIIDYIYFKHFASKDTYGFILTHITNIIDKQLNEDNTFRLHINMKTLTILDIDKHKLFIQNISNYLKEKYPQKLEKCYIYNAPFVFSQIYNIICKFVDKDTQRKIELITK